MREMRKWIIKKLIIEIPFLFFKIYIYNYDSWTIWYGKRNNIIKKWLILNNYSIILWLLSDKDAIEYKK